MSTKDIARDQRITVYGRDWAHIFLGLSGWPGGKAVYAMATVGIQDSWNDIWASALLNGLSAILFAMSAQAKHRLYRNVDVTLKERVSDEH